MAIISVGVAVASCGSGADSITRGMGLASGALVDEATEPYLNTAIRSVAKRAARTTPDPSSASASPSSTAAAPRLRTNGAPSIAYSGRPDGVSIEQINTSGGIIRAREAQAYMQRVLDRLLEHWPYDVPRLGVFIVNNHSFDAAATAGGDILIAAGLVDEIESEDELAAVLAHELGHIALYHHERAKQVADQKRMFNIATNIAVSALLVRNTRVTKVAPGHWQGITNTERLTKQSLQAGALCVAATYLTDTLLDANWSRTQEDEADLFGIDLMIKAGYNTGGAVMAMRRRIAFESQRVSLVESRRANGDYDRMVTDGFQTGGISGAIGGMFRGVAAGLIDTLSELHNEVSRRHHQSQERLEAIQKYLAKFYPERPRTAVLKAQYERVMRSKAFKARIENHLHALGSSEALKADNVQEARAKAELAIRAPTAGSPGPRIAMYQVLMAEGHEDRAFEQLRAVTELEEAPQQYFMLLADGYARRGMMEEAERARANASGLMASMLDAEGEAKKSDGLSFLSVLFDPNHASTSGADRFKVDGFCERLKDTASRFSGLISGGKL